MAAWATDLAKWSPPQEMQQQEVLRRQTLHFFWPFPLLFFLIVLGTLHVYFLFLPHRFSFWVLPAHAVFALVLSCLFALAPARGRASGPEPRQEAVVFS